MSEITKARTLADGAWAEVEGNLLAADLFTDEREAAEAIIASRRELHEALRALVDAIPATHDMYMLAARSAQTLDRTSARAIALVASWAVQP